MSRRLKIQTSELGYLELFLIYETGGFWEVPWRSLQTTSAIRDLLTSVSSETMDHGINGWTSPLVKKLGLPPYGCLLKFPKDLTPCQHRKKCPFFDRVVCLPTYKKTPTCYEPESKDEERPLLSELVRLWKEGVYVVLVQESVACP